jgi:hypothetical protein
MIKKNNRTVHLAPLLAALTLNLQVPRSIAQENTREVICPNFEQAVKYVRAKLHMARANKRICEQGTLPAGSTTHRRMTIIMRGIEGTGLEEKEYRILQVIPEDETLLPPSEGGDNRRHVVRFVRPNDHVLDEERQELK